MEKSVNYPPKELLGSFIKNNEFLLLWMLNNNEYSTWSHLTKVINKSTLSNYLNRFLDNGYAQKLSLEIGGKKKKVYRIKSKGKARFYELSQGKKRKELSFPPTVILRKRNYDHWILWMLYNNNHCKWSDFLNEPLLINQSSLSKNLNYLIEKKKFVRKENREYRITKSGKLAYTMILRQYDLDRQSILEAESSRIREITKETNKFFREHQIKKKNIKFHYINYTLNLPYENEKIKYMFDNKEDFNKVLLFLSLNHPKEFPNYISPEDFSEKYNINLTKLNFAILRIVKDSIYPIRIFKLEIGNGNNYYFQGNEKLEKILRAIVEEHFAKSTYLYNLSETTLKESYIINMDLIIEDILDEICYNLFSSGLKNGLRRFLPEYIHYLAYKVEKKKELKDTYDKLEGLIWQEIEFFNQNVNQAQIYAQNKYRGSIDEINEEIKSKPESVDLYYTKTKTLINLNKYREALELLDNMMIGFPHEEKNILMIKAYILKEMKDPKAGLNIINELITRFPKDMDLLNYKASWLQYLNKKQESLNLIQKLIKKEPNNALYHDTYGEILMFFNNYAKALEEFQKTISINKNNWFSYQTYVKMGICYNILKDYDMAIEFLNKGKESANDSLSDPESKEKWIVIADLILSEIEQLTI
ncbi:MAG: tetratricopeptide repeat protein [Promethearchaeota archaeon]